MKNSVSNNRLAHMFRKFISTQSEYTQKLKGQLLCGSKVIHQQAVQPAVFVLANENESTYFGNAHCNSPWCCPHCSPIVMAKKAKNVACAIDALSTLYKQDACMITFTIPHTKGMTCKDTYDILRATWRNFTAVPKQIIHKYNLKIDVNEENHRGGVAVGKKGEERTYDINRPGWQKVRKLGMIYSVKVYEFTWGEDHGFHPHIHGLFWLPRENFQKIGQLEEELFECWWKCAKAQTLKYYKNKHPETSDEENAKIVDKIFTDWRKTPKTGHRSVHISRNEDGSVRVITSSMYLDDWSGDAELTADYRGKEARNGHLNPYQMLVKAHESKDEERIKYLRLFTEYAMATKNTRRMEFGKHKEKDLPQLSEIIKQWKKTQTYTERIKKKCMEKAEKLRLVCWFTEKQWLLICFLTSRYDVDLRSLILEKARLPDGKRKIQELLFENGIDISQNGTHRHEDLIEEIMNEKRKPAESNSNVA